MPARVQSDSCPKAVVSVSEMARMCGGLSRSRFYELVKAGTMPPPTYDLRTRRPLYTREQQEICLLVRTTNIGFDGRFTLFYAQRSQAPAAARPSRRRTTPAVSIPPALMESIRALGMADVEETDVVGALQSCFPNGIADLDEGTVIRSVWRQLRCSEGA